MSFQMASDLYHVTVRVHKKNYTTLMDSIAIADISSKGINSKHLEKLQQQQCFSEAMGEFTRPVDINVHGQATDEDLKNAEQVFII